MSRVYIGTSGYNYKHWSGGIFYPERLPQRKWLEHFCKFFDTVELNVTFYRLPKEDTFRSWYEKTPQEFRFSLKGSRYITHVKKMKESEEPLKLFLSRAALLKEKASVILWQLPPGFKVNTERLEGFVSSIRKLSKLRHVFEFREESWICKDVFDILKAKNIAICMADWPSFNNDLPLTSSDFVYVRRHGASGDYASSYPKKDIQEDAIRIKKWMKKGSDVYIYFNNDAYGYAVENAMTLKRLLDSHKEE